MLGKVVQNPAKLDQDLVAELIEIGQGLPFHTVSGKTVCTNDFYEGIFQFKIGMYVLGELKEIFFFSRSSTT